MEKKEFDLKMRTKDMFSFMMYQQYSGFKGFVMMFINVLVIYCLITRWGAYDVTPKLLLIFVLFLFDIYMPLQLLLRAKNQVVAASRFKGDTHYVLTEEGMEVSKEEECLIFKWPHFLKYKVVFGKVFVYTSRITAFVFPKDLLGDEAYVYLIRRLFDNRTLLGTMSFQTVKHFVNGVEEKDENEASRKESEDNQE